MSLLFHHFNGLRFSIRPQILSMRGSGRLPVVLSRCRDAAIRHASSKNRIKHLERNRAFYERDADIPDFKSLMRQFYKISHPDIIRSTDPVAADINDQSFKELNGVLDTIKRATEYPASSLKVIPFYLVKNDRSVMKSNITIRTAGGDSRKQLARCFVAFFKEIGILQASTFKWNEEYFQPIEAEPGNQSSSQ
jgi:hypothetical protein